VFTWRGRKYNVFLLITSLDLDEAVFLANFRRLGAVSAKLGLTINRSKCEVPLHWYNGKRPARVAQVYSVTYTLLGLGCHQAENIGQVSWSEEQHTFWINGVKGEASKHLVHSDIATGDDFTPLAIETLGTWDDQAIDLVKKIGRCWFGSRFKLL